MCSDSGGGAVFRTVVSTASSGLRWGSQCLKRVARAGREAERFSTVLAVPYRSLVQALGRVPPVCGWGTIVSEGWYSLYFDLGTVISTSFRWGNFVSSTVVRLTFCFYIYLHIFTYIYIYLHIFTYIYMLKLSRDRREPRSAVANGTQSLIMTHKHGRHRRTGERDDFTV